MPTYSYQCDACGHEFDKEQRITEKPVKKCPKCKKLKARRMIAASPGFILKGGGWESDLYSGPSNTSAAASSSDSASSSSESSSSDSSSDSSSSSSSSSDD